MRVSGLELVRGSDETQLSADFGGLRVRFSFPPGEPVEARGGAFLALALPEAMGRGEPLHLDATLPISPVLLEHIGEVQDIYHCWNPDLQPVPVECTAVSPTPARKGAAAFYSGGIDSAYTLLAHQEEITHLVHIEGFDFVTSPAETAERTDHRRRFAERFGKVFLRVATNYREYAGQRKLEWMLVHGNCLAAIALALGFERVFIPSSHTYSQLFPWGSHPLVDPLWSNGRTAIVHDGSGASRIEKLRRIAADRGLLDDITVCWRYADRNCGTCTKCLRALVSLHLLGLSSRAFPPLTSPRQIRSMTIQDRNERAFLEENILLAREVGNAPVERELQRLRRRYDALDLVASVDRLVLGHRLRGVYRRLKHQEWLDLDVTLSPKR